MKYYNVPSDFKKETIDEYERLNNSYEDSKITETYGQISVGSQYTSGRILKDIPKVDLAQLKEYINYSEKKGLEFSYTLNGTCMGNMEFTKEGIEELKGFLDQLYNAGVSTLIVALPSLIELINSTKYKFKIKGSTLCQVTNANKAQYFKKLGIDRIVVEESINREFNTLKSIVDAFGEKVEVIVNTLCYKDCIYRTFHYNQMAHDSTSRASNSITSYYNHLCMLKRAECPENFIKLSWIRPEDIKYYTEIGINHFKIQGRHTVFNGDPVRTVEAYFKESYDGNLLELFELFNPPNSFSIYVDNKKMEGYLKPFFQNDNFCKRHCDKCGYCKSVIEKCIDYEKVKEINQLAKQFYGEYDEYSNALKTIGTDVHREAVKSSITDKRIKNSDISFNFNDYENYLK